MKKPLLARWHIKLTIIVFCVITAYLVYRSFMEGYEEGRQIRLKKLQGK